MVSRRRCLAALYLAALLQAALLFAPGARAQSGDQPEMPDEVRAFVLWEQGYRLHVMGRYEAAVDRFRASIAVLPTAEGHTYLGWSLSMLGGIEEAVAECKKAIALDPDYGNPYNDIGAYLIELGRPEEAIPWFEKAIAAKRYCCYQFPHFMHGAISPARDLRVHLADRTPPGDRGMVADAAGWMDGPVSLLGLLGPLVLIAVVAFGVAQHRAYSQGVELAELRAVAASAARLRNARDAEAERAEGERRAREAAREARRQAEAVGESLAREIEERRAEIEERRAREAGGDCPRACYAIRRGSS